MMKPASPAEIAGALRRAVYQYRVLTIEQARLYCIRIGLPPSVLDE